MKEVKKRIAYFELKTKIVRFFLRKHLDASIEASIFAPHLRKTFPQIDKLLFSSVG